MYTITIRNLSSKLLSCRICDSANPTSCSSLFFKSTCCFFSNKVNPVWVPALHVGNIYIQHLHSANRISLWFSLYFVYVSKSDTLNNSFVGKIEKSKLASDHNWLRIFQEKIFVKKKWYCMDQHDFFNFWPIWIKNLV